MISKNRDQKSCLSDRHWNEVNVQIQKVFSPFDYFNWI